MWPLVQNSAPEECDETAPPIPSRFSSRLRISLLEIANLAGSAVAPIDRSRPSILWTAVTALTSRFHSVTSCCFAVSLSCWIQYFPV